jgi:zinc finger protein 830
MGTSVEAPDSSQAQATTTTAPDVELTASNCTKTNIYRSAPNTLEIPAKMADVRSLLKNERAARRIQHKHASYSTTGTLLCLVCHLQLKSESLWEGHLRSAGHIMRVQKLEAAEKEAPESTISEPQPSGKKRKADGDEEGRDTIHKRSKPLNGFLPEGFFDSGSEPVVDTSKLPSPTTEIQIPSRPATPSKPVEEIPKRPEPTVDEDEWAAFEADIAAADVLVIDNDAVISAPAMTAAELEKKSLEEDYAQRKERQEAELEGDKEDAARKMEEELEEMEGLEARVKRLREKREELRKKESVVGLNKPVVPPVASNAPDEDDEEDEDEDDWDGFRMRA